MVQMGVGQQQGVNFTWSGALRQFVFRLRLFSALKHSRINQDDCFIRFYQIGRARHFTSSSS